jgi:HK97 family phage portal protein
MGLLSWLYEKLGGAVPTSGNALDSAIDEYKEIFGDTFFRELALWSAVNMIASAVSKCEFQTFSHNEKTPSSEYYRWNIEPNKNQNSTQFLRKLISTLYLKNECLVIEQNRQLLVADGYTRTPYVLKEDEFTQVTVGDYPFPNPFKGNEVFFFKLAEADMQAVTNGIFAAYSKLIACSTKAYRKSRGVRGIFKYSTLPIAWGGDRDKFEAAVNARIKKWIGLDSGALTLGEGQNWEESTSKTYSLDTTRDIRAMIDDVSDFTAKAFGIPPALLRGDVQGISDALDQFLTFCIDPLTDMLSEEINRKSYGYEGFRNGNYIKIDTRRIKHIDILSVSTAIDKLIGSGAYSINEIREICGDTRLTDENADAHFITKNYTLLDEALNALSGGGKGGEQNEK